MSQYRVVWVIDIEADTPVQAARGALEIQRDPESVALFFDVSDAQGKNIQTINLNES